MPGWDTWCSDCSCLEPTTTTTTTTASTPPANCIQGWIGDNYCDDQNNNEACQYDGGDCCNNTMPGWDTWCSDCLCLEP